MHAPLPLIIVIDRDRASQYTQAAHLYHDERAAAELWEETDTGAPDYLRQAVADRAADLADSVSDLFGGTLPTLSDHVTPDGHRCPFSQARLDQQLPAAGSACPHGCPTATILAAGPRHDTGV